MREQRGSVLVLLPAAVLVFLVLGALCVDFGGVFSAQRELHVAAAAAASDAASRAIDLEVLYDTGEVRLVPSVAEEVVRRSIAAKGLDRLDPEVVAVEVHGAVVTVRLRGRVRHLFARAVPGGSDGTDVVTTASAESAQE